MGRKQHTDIPLKVKMLVGNRDDWNCVICGAPGDPVAHVVNRSQGGLGIEQNIVTMCYRCHVRMDNGIGGRELRDTCEWYLRTKYPGWTRQRVTYDKWEALKHE